ncbi:hypothetical protein MBLNU457_7727t1 [Dothideomycetes sp. NU457]
MSLHTSDNCSITGTGATGNWQTANCYEGVNGNSGCGFGANDANTPNNYGSQLNSVGGGVYITEWTSRYIQIWYFPRNAIPSSISSGSPNVTQFGKPMALFQGCDIEAHFGNMSIIINTDFCGAWAGNVYGSYDCPYNTSAPSALDACVDYVGDNPQDMINAYWQINSIKVYQMPLVPVNASATLSTTSLTPTHPLSTVSNTIDHGMGQSTSSAPSSLSYTGPLSTLTSASATASATSYAVPICPQYNSSTFFDANSNSYNIGCGQNYTAITFNTTTLTSFEACLELCDVTGSCTGVSYVGGNGPGICYMKSGSGGFHYDGLTYGAFRLDGPPSTSNSASSSGSASASSMSASSTSSTASSNTSVSASATPSMWPDSYATCPEVNGTVMQDDYNMYYTVYCSADTTDTNIAVETVVQGGFMACFDICDATSGCGSFVFGGDTCYLKGANPHVLQNTGNAAYVVGVRVPAPPAPSSSIAPPSNNTAPTTTSQASGLSLATSVATAGPPISTLCGTNVTDTNGDVYAVYCSSYNDAPVDQTTYVSSGGFQACFGICTTSIGCRGFTFYGNDSGFQLDSYLDVHSQRSNVEHGALTNQQSIYVFFTDNAAWRFHDQITANVQLEGLRIVHFHVESVQRGSRMSRNCFNVCGYSYTGTVIDTSNIVGKRGLLSLLLPRATEPTYQDCVNLCDEYPSCVALNYEGTNCTLLSSVTGYTPSTNNVGATFEQAAPSASTSHAVAPCTAGVYSSVVTFSPSSSSSLSAYVPATESSSTTASSGTSLSASGYGGQTSSQSMSTMPTTTISVPASQTVTASTTVTHVLTTTGDPNQAMTSINSGAGYLCFTCMLTPTFISGDSPMTNTMPLLDSMTSSSQPTCYSAGEVGTTTIFSTFTVTACPTPLTCPARGFALQTGRGGALSGSQVLLTTTNGLGQTVTVTQVPLGTGTSGSGTGSGSYGSGSGAGSGTIGGSYGTGSGSGTDSGYGSGTGSGTGSGSGTGGTYPGSGSYGGTYGLGGTPNSAGGLSGSSGYPAAGNATLPVCPGSDGQTFADPNGQLYNIDCGDYIDGTTLSTQNTTSLAACISACDAYNTMTFAAATQCQAVSYFPSLAAANCELKNSVQRMSQVGCDSAILLTTQSGSVNNTDGLGGNATVTGAYGTMTVGGIPSETALGGYPGGGEGTAVSVSVVYGTSTQIANGSTVYATYPVSTVTGAAYGGGAGYTGYGGAGGNYGHANTQILGTSTVITDGITILSTYGVSASTVYGTVTQVSRYVSNGQTLYTTYGVVTAISVSYAPITVTTTTVSVSVSVSVSNQISTVAGPTQTVGGGSGGGSGPGGSGGGTVTVTQGGTTVTNTATQFSFLTITAQPSSKTSSFSCRTVSANYLNGGFGKRAVGIKRSIFDVDGSQPQPGARPLPYAVLEA